MSEQDIAAFRNAALALRNADKTVLREVAKSMRTVARPVVAAIRAEVRSSKGSSERGATAAGRERQLHALARSGRGHGGKPLTERQVRSTQRRIARLTSLRESIAAAAGAQVSASATKAGLAFKVKSSTMPPSQRKLPRRWDKPGGWRHPVYGNRNVWVKQVGNPYFRSTINSRREQVTTGVVAAMVAAAEQITHGRGPA